MKKEKQETTTSWWKKLIQKRYFFPALYLGLAAILLSVVVWYQTLDRQISPEPEEALEVSDHYVPVNQSGLADDEGTTEEESIQKPVSEDTEVEIVTKFYDYDADEEDQEKALILFDKHFYQSKGIDLASVNGEPFDVLASLSGTVTTVKPDPVLGNVVIISHDEGVETYYSSLEEVNVQEGDRVTQGDVIGLAGTSVIGKDHGIHVHFEIRKDNVAFNPEEYFNQSVNSLVVADAEESDEVDGEANNEANEENNADDNRQENDELREENGELNEEE